VKAEQLVISLILGLGLTLALLWLLGGATLPAAHAAPSQCPNQYPLLQAGDVITVCLSGGCDCTSIQGAVDAAAPGDEIFVATGTYTDVHVRPRSDFTTTGVVTQVVYISKTVTIRGGYTTTNWTTPYPITQPTTLDAQGQGRVLYITGDISPTIEGLRITGGDAAGLHGFSEDAGGGVYVISATTIISNNQVFSNTSDADGGGLCLRASDATLSGNTVMSNTAYGDSYGGGLCLVASDATLSGNTFLSNTAHGGGGLVLAYSTVTLYDNTILYNAADGGGGLDVVSGSVTLISSNIVISNTAYFWGGGLYLHESAATLSGNTIISNTAGEDGGGLYLAASDASLSGNTVVSNTARYGSGLYLDSSPATLGGNTIISNTASEDGGGLCLRYSSAIFSGNTIISNSAKRGGGLYLSYGSDATLLNNLVADNRTSSRGSGLYILASSPCLLHTTIVRNTGGDGSGVLVTYEGFGDYSAVTLTNTILVSHTVGITVGAGNTVTLNATLWGTDTWANDTDWGGAGNIFTGTVNIWDDSAFANSDAGDYHITAASAAIDQGVNAGVMTDIDGDTRPDGCFSDIGADEFMTGVACGRIYLPLIMRQYQ
jgi:fibronectin-binding autotransporter adhesin